MIKNYFSLTILLAFFISNVYCQGTLEVSGNTLTILNLDTTPNINDNTDFSDVVVAQSKINTFILDNTVGGGSPSNTLNDISVVISGSTDFMANASSLGSLSGNGTPINLGITFTPSSLGSKTATITITYTNGVNASYEFDVTGNGASPSPEINIVDANSSAISDESTDSPSLVNNTDFGVTNNLSSIIKNYTIENIGTANLNLTSITSDNSDFVITVQPSMLISNGGTSNFSVSFTPSSNGVSLAIITILSNDSDESEYTFSLKGTGDLSLTTLSLINTFSLTVLEPSGLAFDKANNQLYTVSDNTGMIYKLSTSGVTLQTLSYSGSDLEGVSMYKPGKLLVAVEGSRELVEYDCVNDVFINSNTMSYSNTDLSAGGDNSRIEGVTYDALNDEIYFLNEKNPGALVKADGNFNVLSEHPLNYAGDYSGAHYVAETGNLWLGSDQTSTVYKCTTNGTVIDSYSLKTSGGNTLDKFEGITIDYDNQLLYAVSDGGQELYVYQINNPALSISEIEVSNKTLKVYPNPVKNNLNIELINKNKITKVNIYNPLGQLEKVISINPQNIDVSNLNSGMYFLEIKTNNHTYTKKLIVQK